ncbi:LysR family transcriptional regulator [Ruegeria pomeroyi]|nr:LysR family transcriptional regulator [Ruegeria pomeroyi]
MDELRLSLRMLRSFMVAVETGSITGAAEALNLAPSAVAAALDRVEAEFGTTLVRRARARGIAPTPAGQALAARVRGLIDNYGDVMHEGYALGHALQGKLHIGYYAPTAPAFLPAILTPLLARHPKITLDLRECDNITAQTGLLEGRLDISIFAGDELLAGVETRPLLDLPPYVLLPEGHALTADAEIDPQALTGQPMVVLDLPLAGPYVRGLLRRAGIEPHIVATVSTLEMVRALVGAGLGIAVLNMRPKTMLSYAGDSLVARPLGGGLPCLHLVSGRAEGPPRKVVQVVETALHDWFAGPEAQALVMPGTMAGQSPITAPGTSA